LTPENVNILTKTAEKLVFFSTLEASVCHKFLYSIVEPPHTILSLRVFTFMYMGTVMRSALVRKINKAGVGVIFGALAGFAAMHTAPAVAGDQDFAVINATGYTISELYVSPVKSNDWEEDILGRDVLTDGERTDITFSRSEDICKWDLKVVYEDDDSSAEWGSLDLCEISVVTLKYSRSSGETSAIIE